MNSLLQSFSEALQNQFLSGGLVLMLTASLLALCRKVPFQLWLFVLRRCTVVVDVSNDDPLFAWLSLWLAEHPYSRRARALTATSERDDYGRVITSAEPNELPQVLLTPAPGNHLLWYRGRMVWLSRERKEATPSKDDTLIGLMKREVFTLRVVGRKQMVARDLLEAARACALNRRNKKIEVFTASYDYWQRIDERDPRPLSSVFLPDGQVQSVTEDVEKFLASSSWYLQYGIPWQRRYLFFGLPRTGKTSLICALAGHFRMNLCILNLGGPYLTDDSLLALLAKVPARSFVLLEDIDCAFNGRDKSEEAKNKLTFSGLLNALDGAGAKQGSLIFMTTNHLERLDPALVGAGRADYKLEFGYAGADQANRMFSAYFPDAGGADGFGARVEGLRLTMADVQNHLIQHRDSAIRALNELDSKRAA